MPKFVEVNGIQIEVPTPPAKGPHNCTMEELQDYLYRQNDYEDKVRRAVDGQSVEVGQQLDTERLYSMPMAQLEKEIQEQDTAAKKQELEKFRVQNAYTWMPNCPQYRQTPQNAQAMIDELDRRKMQGTVADLATVFESLAAQGKLELNNVPPAPKRIYSVPELQAMQPDELREAIEQMSKDGIF